MTAPTRTDDGLARGEPLTCQQGNGAPGVGRFFLTAPEALGAAPPAGTAGAPGAGFLPGVVLLRFGRRRTEGGGGDGSPVTVERGPALPSAPPPAR